MNIAELAQRFPDWRNPEAVQVKPPSARKIIGPWRKNGRKVKPVVDHGRLMAARERKRRHYWKHRIAILDRMRRKRNGEHTTAGATNDHARLQQP